MRSLRDSFLRHTSPRATTLNPAHALNVEDRMIRQAAASIRRRGGPCPISFHLADWPRVWCRSPLGTPPKLVNVLYVRSMSPPNSDIALLWPHQVLTQLCPMERYAPDRPCFAPCPVGGHATSRNTCVVCAGNEYGRSYFSFFAAPCMPCMQTGGLCVVNCCQHSAVGNCARTKAADREL